MDTYQVKPKAVVGDMAFHIPAELVDFYKYHAIKQIPTGPHTPWPKPCRGWRETLQEILFLTN